MAVSTISDNDQFWGSLKKAHGQLPKGAKWTLAVASTDGAKAVNVIVHDSVDGVRNFFDLRGVRGPLEADAANAVGLPK